MRLRCLRITLEQHARCSQLHRGSEDLLLDAIVQIAREAVALFGHRQIVQLPLGLAQFRKQLLVR
jgi:hypothetical protein